MLQKYILTDILYRKASLFQIDLFDSYMRLYQLIEVSGNLAMKG